jgi:hypothetical protein
MHTLLRLSKRFAVDWFVARSSTVAGAHRQDGYSLRGAIKYQMRSLWWPFDSHLDKRPEGKLELAYVPRGSGDLTAHRLDPHELVRALDSTRDYLAGKHQVRYSGFYAKSTYAKLCHKFGLTPENARTRTHTFVSTYWRTTDRAFDPRAQRIDAAPLPHGPARE